MERLQALLPEGWHLQPSPAEIASDPGVDPVIYILGPSGGTQVIVVARRHLTPRGVEGLLRGPAEALRRQSRTPLLVVAPVLSARTRQRLRDAGILYLDLTGPTFLTMASPGLHVELAGPSRAAAPRAASGPTLRGPRAGRVLRLLADVVPPYGVGELARAAGVSLAYTSRLLEGLDAEALLTRGRRGRVEAVDWAGLLRRWAEAYALLRTHTGVGAIARHGVPAVLDALRGQAGPWAITGSYAAVRLAPVAAPALLAVYTGDPSAWLEPLQLLAAPSGHDVVLLRPADRFVYARAHEADGLRYAGPSQVALDCLTGPGRMPAEGEALLTWMAAHPTGWQLPALAALPAAPDPG
ncbi:MAG TPA: helix-turn-helix domain-containing protein [Candidatus Dormibacteraeota bacterium]|nr:helix-turn-helix domain-containing protein [Candidatus Dormibacteraeota bacterium]